MTIAKAPSSPISLRHLVDQRLADAVELGLVDEPLARVRRRVGVIADDVDPLLQRLLQHRCDRHRVVGREQDAVHAARDVVVDEGDLLVDVGLGRPVRGHGDVAELGRGVLHALAGRVEVADPDQLGHVHDRDRLAVQVRRAGRRGAVERLGRRCRRGTITARQRADRQVVRPVPATLRHGGRRQQHRAQANTQISQHLENLPGDARPPARLRAVMAQRARGFKPVAAERAVRPARSGRPDGGARRPGAAARMARAWMRLAPRQGPNGCTSGKLQYSCDRWCTVTADDEHHVVTWRRIVAVRWGDHIQKVLHRG